MYKELEALVDVRGLASVVFALAEVCRDKALYLQAKGGHDGLARQWRRRARELDSVIWE